MDREFSIQIDGPGLNVEADVPSDSPGGSPGRFRPALWRDLSRSDGRTPRGGAPSFRDYVAAAKPSTNAERIATVAAWLYDWERLSLDPDQLGKYFDRAGWKKPSNPEGPAESRGTGAPGGNGARERLPANRGRTGANWPPDRERR